VVGRAVLVGRLAGRDLRRRPAEAALLLLAILGATITLTLGLALRGVTDEPYQSTREATAGPDVVASTGADGDQAFAGLEALTDAAGVVGHSGPYPLAETVLGARGYTVAAVAEGRDPAAAPIDQPDLTDGRWVEDGGVVVEAAFADALDLRPGEPITLNGRSFRVVGVAVTAATPPYPEVSCLGGICPEESTLVWLTRADVRSLVPQEQDLGHVLNLRLADPADAPAFVDEHANRPPLPLAMSWQDVRDRSAHLVSNQQRVLLVGSRLIALLALASVTVLVGGRMADQTRRVGLLKAVGGTPALATAVLLAEYVVVALAGAAMGLALGRLAAPLLTEPSAGLLGRSGAPPLTLAVVGQVTAVALLVAVLATVGPAVRAARTSTVRVLADAPRLPRRTAWVLALSARLPVPLLLGSRVAARRPRRAVLAALSVFVTVSGVVAALGAHADLHTDELAATSLLEAARVDRLNQSLLVITVTLVVLAAVNAIFITTATVIDNRHTSALARALGATPQQVSAGLAAAQVLPALAGAVLAIPGGIGLLSAVDPDAAPIPPLWQLVAVVPGTVLVVAALTMIPAHIGIGRPLATTLRSETI
jgi:putative ABC transport system permease protein